MSPAEKEARQMIADKKMMEASTRAYNRADQTPSSGNETMTDGAKVKRQIMQILRPSAEPNVDAMGNETGMKKGGKVKDSKFMSFTKTGKPDGMKSVTRMSSGGSASKRADGIATKGKTRGKIC